MLRSYSPPAGRIPAVVDDLGFDLLAASLRADAGDLRAFAEALAVKLEQALPDHTRVERRGGFLSREHPVRSIAITFGDVCYRLEVDGGRLDPCRQKEVRGIVLHTDALALEEWIDGLSQELTALAASSEQARAALARMLGAS
jgi:hypothetical protein